MEKLEEAIADAVLTVYKSVYETEDCDSTQPFPMKERDCVERFADFLDELELYLKSELSLNVEIPSEFFGTIGDLINYLCGVVQKNNNNLSDDQSQQ